MKNASLERYHASADAQDKRLELPVITLKEMIRVIRQKDLQCAKAIEDLGKEYSKKTPVQGFDPSKFTNGSETSFSMHYGYPGAFIITYN